MKQPSAAVLIAAALLFSQPSLAKGASSHGKDLAGGASASKADASAKGVSKPAVPASDSGPGAANRAGAEENSAEAAANEWSAEEIAQAKAHCEKVLRGVEAVIAPADPIKEGECGAPAPVRLISIGRNPEITVSPPVTVTCDLVATLSAWIKEDLQPLAKRHLGAPIVRMNTMSSYSCRNAYGRKKTRLSEHALANAIDIGSFTASDGSKADLLKGWGLTARDVEAIVAKAKAAMEAEQKSADATKAAARRAAGAKDAATAGRVVLTASPGTFGDRHAPLPVRKPPAAARQWRVHLVTPTYAATSRGTAARVQPGSRAVLLSAASHLGGPQSDAADAVPAAFDPEDGVAQFLRAAHETACKRFGTVLGPEANEAHRNHFHLDMAQRKYRNYCE